MQIFIKSNKSIIKNVFFSYNSKLKNLLETELIPKKKAQLEQIKKKYSNKVIAQVKLEQILGGMRDIPCLFYEGSILDPIKGIKMREYYIPQIQQKCPKSKGLNQPLPQSVLYLLFTGKFPNDQQWQDLKNEIRQHYGLDQQSIKFILSLNKNNHPMTMLSQSLLQLQKKSKFFKLYSEGKLKKTDYWKYFYDDAINLISKIPEIAAIIYRHKFKDGKIIPLNKKLDWAGAYAQMLGFQGEQFKQALRGYLSIHSDHQGGNVSAHTMHLVGSALSDPFLSYSAGVNGLAGPLHGLKIKQYYLKSEQPTPIKIQEFVNKTMSQGKDIPGYGHAVLKYTDPRFTHLKKFANRYIKDDYICNLVIKCSQTIPDLLKKTGKIKNPYTSVDAFSGAILYYYGMKEFDYYTIIFAVSRSLGCMANAVWSRAFNLPLQRPLSLTINTINKICEKK